MTHYYCTYFDRKYLDRGLALYESMDRHCLPFHLWILAMCDETLRRLRRLALPNVTVVSMSEFETPELLAVKLGRTWQEYIWTCTGSWMLYILTTHPDIDHLCYLDSDCFFFGDPGPMFEEIGEAPVGITPHHSSPSWQHLAPQNGIYNVGAVYVCRSRRGIGCLREWAEQCIDWCYYRRKDGKMADQKYLDPWPERWGAHPIRHKGVNLAPWNQDEGQYTYSLRDGRIYVDEDALIYYHFHGRLIHLKQDSFYPIDPFVADHVYGPYKAALERAQC